MPENGAPPAAAPKAGGKVKLEVLEACLRAIPEFVRTKTRRLAPLTITVPVASGELPLVLSWAAG